MNQREYLEVMFNSEIPYPQRLLYAYLRSCADFKTGIAGDARYKRLSYQGIREALEYVRGAGARTRPETFSNDRIHKLLKSLEQLGVVVSLDKAPAVPGRKPTIRKFLPLAVGELIRPQEVGDRSATQVGDDQTQAGQGFPDKVGDCGKPQVGDTSVKNTLSLNNYIYYEPDIDDAWWVRDVLHLGESDQLPVNVDIETEKFNLRYSCAVDYNLVNQRQDWRLWMIRHFEHRGLV